MIQEGGAALTLVSKPDSEDLVGQDDQNDPNKITKHHRKLKSDGGGNHRSNISHVPLFKHRAWHALYDDLPPEDIIRMFKRDYEVFGTDYVKSDLIKELHEKWANNTKEKIKRQKAWHVLFAEEVQDEIIHKTLEEIVEEINTIWLDPDYEILIGMVRVKTVQLQGVSVHPRRE